ncbi:substrate-binding periplasmic protein [Marinomonas fungiae]|uniref:substrate-binding periplasmic protein n=1 Tax=Marinomonas fungiae TaxID=1137284 RepID=UPI003A8CC4E4
MRAVILALSLLLSNAAIWAAESQSPAAQATHLTVRLCGTTAYPPNSWIAPSGRVEGVNAMVVRTLMAKFGITVDDQQNSNWQRCLKEIELGNVDVLTGFRNEQRAQYMAYLDTPIVKEDINLFYPANQPVEFQGWESLTGLRVGVLMGDSFGDRADAALNQYLSLEWVSSQHQNLLKLADNRLDVVPMGRLSGQLQIDALGLTEKIGSTATDVSDYWYVGISKKSPLMQWYPELNRALAELLSDATFVSEGGRQQRDLYLQTMARMPLRQGLP